MYVCVCVSYKQNEPGSQLVSQPAASGTLAKLPNERPTDRKSERISQSPQDSPTNSTYHQPARPYRHQPPSIRAAQKLSTALRFLFRFVVFCMKCFLFDLLPALLLLWACILFVVLCYEIISTVVVVAAVAVMFTTVYKHFCRLCVYNSAECTYSPTYIQSCLHTL